MSARTPRYGSAKLAASTWCSTDEELSIQLGEKSMVFTANWPL